jgi:hypothetical protein
MRGMMGWRKFAIVGAGLTTLLVVADLTFGLPFLFGYENTSLGEIASRERFESDTWKKVRESDDPARIRMVDDLLTTHRLVGMSRPQIDALLGVPDRTSNFRAYNYVYWLGPERGLISIDSEWLGIRFENGFAVEAKLLRD